MSSSSTALLNLPPWLLRPKRGPALLRFFKQCQGLLLLLLAALVLLWAIVNSLWVSQQHTMSQLSVATQTLNEQNMMLEAQQSEERSYQRLQARLAQQLPQFEAPQHTVRASLQSPQQGLFLKGFFPKPQSQPTLVLGGF